MKHVDHCEVNNSTKTVTTDSLSIQFANYSFITKTPDKISGIQLYAKSPAYSFKLDLACNTSRTILNAGNGQIAWGPNRALSNSTHWSIPAARTSGSLTLGTRAPLTVDESRSFTWYDHQDIHGGAPLNFTWFEAHFADPNIRVSIWAYDWADTAEAWRYATVRIGEETTLVLPYTWEVDWSDAWVSGESNRTFPQQWTLTFDNGDFLRFRSVKKEQEIMTGAWTGFVTVHGRFMGQTTGVGVVDSIYI